MRKSRFSRPSVRDGQKHALEYEPNHGRQGQATQVGQLVLKEHELEPGQVEAVLHAIGCEVEKVLFDVELLERLRQATRCSAVEEAGHQIEDAPLVGGWRAPRCHPEPGSNVRS